MTDTAFPATRPGESGTTSGLTIREYFAAAALPLVVRSFNPETTSERDLAHWAVVLADALIRELSREPKE